MSDKQPKPPEGAPADPSKAGESRRDLLKVLGLGGLGLGLAAVVAVPAGGYLLYPLGHTTVSGGDDFLPIGKTNLFDSGKPVKVELYADKRDAWNRVTQVKIGSAWIVAASGELKAFSTVCPHLGCAIDYDPAAGKFKCPCHRSSFTLKGEVEGGPAPRGMDELPLKKNEDGLVAIRYQRFKQGVSQKETV